MGTQWPALLTEGRDFVALDDISTGHASRLPADVPLVEAPVLNEAAVRTALCGTE